MFTHTMSTYIILLSVVWTCGMVVDCRVREWGSEGEGSDETDVGWSLDEERGIFTQERDCCCWLVA